MNGPQVMDATGRTRDVVFAEARKRAARAYRDWMHNPTPETGRRLTEAIDTLERAKAVAGRR